MSWSISVIGKPEAVKRALARQSETLTGQSKEEFDAVKPALDTILDQNVENGLIQLNANGHASFSDGKKTFSNCSVEVKALAGQLAE
jgi:hypothetical protein